MKAIYNFTFEEVEQLLRNIHNIPDSGIVEITRTVIKNEVPESLQSPGDIRKAIIDFVQSQPNQSTRASNISSALNGNSDRKFQQSINNAILKLQIEGTLEVVTEYSDKGVLRLRNRLMRLKTI